MFLESKEFVSLAEEEIKDYREIIYSLADKLILDLLPEDQVQLEVNEFPRKESKLSECTMYIAYSRKESSVHVTVRRNEDGLPDDHQSNDFAISKFFSVLKELSH